MTKEELGQQKLEKTCLEQFIEASRVVGDVNKLQEIHEDDDDMKVPVLESVLA